MLSWFRYQ